MLAVNPACRVLWRSAQEVQLELGQRAVVVEGAGCELVGALVRPRSAGAVTLAGVPDPVRPALAALVDAGYLWELPDDPAEVFAPPQPRLVSELAALALTRGRQAAEVLAARPDRAVVVHGDSVLAALTATLLAAAGIGRVHHAEPGRATLPHVHAALGEQDAEGRPLNQLTAQAIARAAPEVDTLPLPWGERPDLVVLAHDGAIDPARLDLLHAEQLPHISIGARHGSVVVGPLVIPGLTACLGCLELHRLDRDPAWHALAAQLGVRAPRPQPCAGWLAAAGAALACGQVLAYLDGDQLAVLDATLELGAGSWQPQRRSWPSHPGCECRA